MRNTLLASAAIWASLLLAASAAGAADGSGPRRDHARQTRPKSYRSSSDRARHPVRRTSRRPIIRHTVVSLPQLRTELSRLETGFGTQVQRIENVMSRQSKPAVVITPAPPPPTPAAPGVPVSTAVKAALAIAALTGGLGVGLGYLWARRNPAPRASLSSALDVALDGNQEEEVEARAWSRLQEALDETQRRLSIARARLRRLER